MKTPKRTPLTFEPGEKVVFLGIDEAAVRAHVELAEILSGCALKGDDRSLCAQVRDTAVGEELKACPAFSRAAQSPSRLWWGRWSPLDFPVSSARTFWRKTA